MSSHPPGALRHGLEEQPFSGLHAVVVRCPHPHALLRGISLDLRFNFDDVTLTTAADLAPTWTPPPGRTPPLVGQLATWAGDPVAVVAAPTLSRAREAARRLKVDWRALPALLDPAKAASYGRVIVPPDNVLARLPDAPALPDIDAPRLQTAAGSEPVALTTLPMVVEAHPSADGKLLLRGPFPDPTSSARILEGLLAQAVQLEVVGRWEGRPDLPDTAAAQAGLVALKAQRPVRLHLGPHELRLADPGPAPLRVTVSSPTTDEGRLLALSVDLLADGGAASGRSAALLEAAARVQLPYKVPHLRVAGRSVATHRPGADGRGGPDVVAFAVERHLDAIARTLSLDPVQLRRFNAEDGPAEEMLTAVEQLLDAPPEPRTLLAPARLMAGRGITLARLAPPPPPSGQLDVQLKQESLALLLPFSSVPHGLDTTLAEVVRESLGLSLESVDLDDTRPALPRAAAANLLPALVQATRTACATLKAAVAAELGVKGDFRAMVRQRRTARKLRIGIPWVSTACDAFGGCAADVLVDLDSGEIQILRLCAAASGSPDVAAFERGLLEGCARALGRVPDASQTPEIRTRVVAGAGGADLEALGPALVPAAVAQAIETAVTAVVDRWPFTPERVLEAMP